MFDKKDITNREMNNCKLVNSIFVDNFIREDNNIEISSKIDDSKNKINLKFERTTENNDDKSSYNNLYFEDNYKTQTFKKNFLNENSNNIKRIASGRANQNKYFDNFIFQKRYYSDRFNIKNNVNGGDFIFTTPKINNFSELSKEFLGEINNFDFVSKKKLSKEYFLNPILKDESLICKIKIQTKNKFGSLYPIYTLHIDSSDKFLLAAKKVKITSSSLYLFSLDENNFDVKSEDYLGKLKSNFLGTKFNIFDYKDKNINEKNFIDREASKEMIEIDYVKLFYLLILLLENKYFWFIRS